MKERPIIFSAHDVRAILSGRKTQVRRILKPQPLEGYAPDSSWIRPFEAGQRLWVRGAWRIGAWDENGGLVAIDYRDGPRREWLTPETPEQFKKLLVQSCEDAARKFGAQAHYEWAPGESPCRWRPSIHMPRWASRITLEVTNVRVQRLQDISEDDAIAEGVEQVEPFFECPCWRDYMEPDAEESCFPDDPVGSFSSLWQSMHGPQSWEQNPWTRLIEFRRVEP